MNRPALQLGCLSIALACLAACNAPAEPTTTSASTTAAPSDADRGQSSTAGELSNASDAALQADRIDRVYDTYASEQEFCENDDWIADFVLTLHDLP